MVSRSIEFGRVRSLTASRKIAALHFGCCSDGHVGPKRCHSVPVCDVVTSTLAWVVGLWKAIGRLNPTGGHWATATNISAIRLDGVATAMATAGPSDALAFQGYIERFLLSVIREGDVVVMDNVSGYKLKGVTEMVESAGAQVWSLPPYSPDLKPIEPMWAKVKSCLRAAAERTGKTLIKAIGNALKRVSADECINYFRHCGCIAT